MFAAGLAYCSFPGAAVQTDPVLQRAPRVERSPSFPAGLRRVASALHSAPRCCARAFGEKLQEGVFVFNENILLPRGKGLVGRGGGSLVLFFDLEAGLDGPWVTHLKTFLKLSGGVDVPCG